MPVHPEDFGKDIIPVQGNEIFFLDTNVVIAFLYKKDRHHRVCVYFLLYLLSKNVNLCVSEIVLSEAVNGLARIFYTIDRVETVGGDPTYHRSRWGRYVIKYDTDSLAKFNQIACERILQLLTFCLIAPAEEEQILEGMRISYEYPLASADALIVSSACFSEASGIISLDRDLRIVPDMTIYTTRVENSQFDPEPLINRLGIEFQNYLLSTLGEAEYTRLFLDSSASTSNFP